MIKVPKNAGGNAIVEIKKKTEFFYLELENRKQYVYMNFSTYLNKKRKKKLINEKETIFFPLRKIKKNEV